MIDLNNPIECMKEINRLRKELKNYKVMLDKSSLEILNLQERYDKVGKVMKIEDLEEELDKQFPKGDKARGRALVLFALAKIMLEAKK